MKKEISEITIQTGCRCPKCHEYGLRLTKKNYNSPPRFVECASCDYVEYALVERECKNCFQEFKIANNLKNKFCIKCSGSSL